MKNRVYNAKNGLWYEKQGDYYLPCLELSEQVDVEVGVRDTDSIYWHIIRSNTTICFQAAPPALTLRM